MSNYKILLMLLLPLASCMQQRMTFSFNDQVDNRHFFNNVLKEAKVFYPQTEITGFDSAKIFTAVYRETYIESDQLLEWSELHDSSRIPRVDYYKVIGSITRMYLCPLQTYPEDINAAVFFSVKYDPDGSCLGFGPAYFGILDPDKGTITFTTQLVVKQQDENFQLMVTRQQNRKAGVLFTSQGFMNGAIIHNRKPVKVDKIILLDPNKIGGIKPVVFSIRDILKDDNALQFRYLKTISFR